ncbi:MAG TPA: AMP-binding protein, partial [Bryobacteraceae bacterium]|nr:AMP-binding protein [Bryobacteraceae bacterium]
MQTNPRSELKTQLILKNVVADHPQAGARCARRLCAPHLVAAAAEATPGAIALSEGSAKMTYAELDARANRLASYLRSLGVGV